MSGLDLDSDGRRIQDSILRAISSNFISVDKAMKAEYGSRLLSVMDYLLGKMQEDKFFAKIFQKTHQTGSYWDGLKVGLPNEYDINLIYRFPFQPHEYLFRKAAPGYIIVNAKRGLDRVKNDNKIWEHIRKLENWFDEEGNFIADNFRRWQESIIEKSIANLPNHCDGGKILNLLQNDEEQIYQIKFCKAGPGITIKVALLEKNLSFQVDVVPAVEFSSQTLWPPIARQCPQDVVNGRENWHIVPKPFDAKQRAAIKVEHSLIPLCWRLSFHDIEYSIIHNSRHMKPTLKFLKKLRDVKSLTPLHSYALKTVVLWQNIEVEKQFWQQNLSFLFLKMIETLSAHLSNGGIKFYWDSELNLLNIDAVQLKNICNNIGNSLTRIRNGLQTKDTFVIARELCTKDEFDRLQEIVSIKNSPKGKVLACFTASRSSELYPE